jgi:hypothetical protein
VSSTAAPLANDGDTSTVWTTPTSAVFDDWWVVVDLEEAKTISSVRVAWGVAHPTLYMIEAGNDGSSWIMLHNESGGASHTSSTQPDLTTTLPVPYSARWLRIRASAMSSVAVTSNVLQTGVATAGGFGGTCTCPDGSVS